MLLLLLLIGELLLVVLVVGVCCKAEAVAAVVLHVSILVAGELAGQDRRRSTAVEQDRSVQGQHISAWVRTECSSLACVAGAATFLLLKQASAPPATTSSLCARLPLCVTIMCRQHAVQDVAT